MKQYIFSPPQMLSASDLLRLKKATDRSLPSVGGSKDYAPNDSILQLKQIENALQERRLLLEEERVVTKALTTIGTWLPEIQMVQIEKAKGKFWQYMGHVERNMLLLFPEEALFLIETGSLLVFFNGVPMSIQDAYHSLLSNDLSTDQYNVFAHLCRLGYIVLRHNDGIHFSYYERKIRLDKYVDLRQGGKVKVGKRSFEEGEGEEAGKVDDELECVARKKVKVEQQQRGEKNGDHRVGSCAKRREASSNCPSEVVHGELANAAAAAVRVHEELTSAAAAVERVHEELATEERPFTSANLDIVFPHMLQPATFETIYFDDLFPANVKVDVAMNAAMFSSTCAATPLTASVAAAMTTRPANWREFKARQHGAHSGRDCLLQPSRLATVNGAYSQLRLSDGVHLTQIPTSGETAEDRFQLSYDVYLPGKHFRKSHAGTPDIRVAVTRADKPPPTLNDIVSLQSRFQDGVPALFAVVDQGSVAFYNFADVALPVDIHT